MTDPRIRAAELRANNQPRDLHERLRAGIESGRVDLEVAKAALADQLPSLRGQLIEWGYCAFVSRLEKQAPVLGDGFSTAAEIIGYPPTERPPLHYYGYIQDHVHRLAGEKLGSRTFAHGIQAVVAMLLLETSDGLALRREMFGDPLPFPVSLEIPEEDQSVPFEYPVDRITVTVCGVPNSVIVGRGWRP